MKNWIALSVIAYLFLISCEIRQDIYFDKNGGGELVAALDFSELMNSGGMGKKMMGKDAPALLDTVFSMEEFLKQTKDSISVDMLKNEPELKILKDTKVRVKMDSINGVYKIQTNNTFENVEALNTLSKLINDNAKKEEGKDQGMVSSMFQNPNNTIMKWKKKRFEMYTEQAGQTEEKPKTDGMENAFMQMVRYKVTYHFPRKIKKLTSDHFTINPDQKSITMDLDYKKMLEQNDLFNCKVKFK